MYYYILESPDSRGVRQTYQRLRDILTNLGIAGEMVASSPARTPEELAAMGLEKSYSTIVAVGGDHFINQIARSVVGRAVLGIVPINASRQVTDLIGATSIRDAAESLRQRRLTQTSIAVAEPDVVIFLDAVIEVPKLAKASLVVDGKMRAFAYFNRLIITRGLEIKLESSHSVEQKKIFGLFGTGGKVIKSESFFHGRSVRVVTDPELPLMVAGEPIAKTPLQFKLIPDALKVITRRGTLT
ncbi:hypothetical protein A3A71_02995 [Candidatus Berkelbacteria bacterium RIFCSPLOWO2_01_FULL_50_28]|uniref:DAGKc domain-containing protein n=1 Tax=Candidatus Berkelbacteria bacterium RIFCSPLOWO2_01_FULL_50_28 TaxID=1797471 RepID=A0A1F5ECU9_9BACT|nr:MAG: hypothetical protein A2807_02560 [Candidatus Berkelbacteria bacterium RIFCSPHIGHO2_01_FULL_50_36]OGD65034.1 MAG: hypothetical protein A3A71_02995 [Candidatus Berkelbacteria bacterium RIFCSPLOWO2_01_FULL_50_28]